MVPPVESSTLINLTVERSSTCCIIKTLRQIFITLQYLIKPFWSLNIYIYIYRSLIFFVHHFQLASNFETFSLIVCVNGKCEINRSSRGRWMMARTCSKCGKMGHNSRTCSSTTTHYHWTQLLKMKERGGNSFRLFGVQLDHHDLSSSSSSSSSFSQISSNIMINRQERWSMDFLSSSTSLRPTSCLSGYEANIGIIGYRYQGGLQETNFNKEVGGVAWSEEEHRRFLEGIEKLGNGDWKGISKNYVTTRSPTQIASHAQKYFLRLQNTTAATATIDNLDPYRKRCRYPGLSDVGKDQPVSARLLIDINTYNPNVEASVNNSYERRPADHHSNPLRFDVNSKNSSLQSAAVEGGEPDLELKLAAT